MSLFAVFNTLEHPEKHPEHREKTLRNAYYKNYS